MSRLGASLLGELPILSVDEVIERIDAVGIEDLRELAAELFAPSGCRSPASAPTRRASAPRSRRSEQGRSCGRRRERGRAG